MIFVSKLNGFLSWGGSFSAVRFGVLSGEEPGSFSLSDILCASESQDADVFCAWSSSPWVSVTVNAKKGWSWTPDWQVPARGFVGGDGVAAIEESWAIRD